MSVPPHLAEAAVVAVAEETVRAELYRHAADLAAEACTPGLARVPVGVRCQVVCQRPASGWWLVALAAAVMTFGWRRR